MDVKEGGTTTGFEGGVFEAGRFARTGGTGRMHAALFSCHMLGVLCCGILMCSAQAALVFKQGPSAFDGKPHKNLLLTVMPLRVRDKRLREGMMMSQESSPMTPAVRSTSHLNSLAGFRAAATVFRSAPVRAQHSMSQRTHHKLSAEAQGRWILHETQDMLDLVESCLTCNLQCNVAQNLSVTVMCPCDSCITAAACLKPQTPKFQL